MGDPATTATTFLTFAIAACFLLSGFVKGVIGMGLPTVAMGLLGLLMPPVEAAALLILPSFVTNLWQMLAGPSILKIGRRLLSMQVFIFAGTFIGVRFMVGSTSHLGSLILGSTLALYAVIGLCAVRFLVKPALEPWLSPLIGAATGLLTGATGVFVVPAVPYFASLGLGREDLIQALGLSFTVSTVALGLALFTHGAYSTGMLGHTLLALIPALAGMFLGQAIRTRLQPETFRLWFFTGLLLVGLYMAVRALVG